MKITYLLESAAGLWGGVKSVLEDANALQGRGHEVTVVSRSGPPEWMQLECGFAAVQSFAPQHLPEADLVIGTFWTTVPAAVQSGKGVPVHYCQGFEGDNPENAAWRERIEAVYRLPTTHKMTISPHLTRTLAHRFGWRPIEVVYSIDDAVMTPAAQLAQGKPVRIGLVGPYEIAWKDIPTGIEACRLAHLAGLDLQLVRVSNTEIHGDERDLPFAVERHRQIPPAAMGALYRSLHVFLGTSRGDEEGFFLPAVEAMASGVPCVLTDIPCFRGYGEGQYALFVEPQNPVELAQALVLASLEPGLRAALREQGLEVAARYGRERHLDALEQAFESILEGAAGLNGAAGTVPPELARLHP